MVERIFGALAAAVMIIASLGALAYRGISGVLDPVKWAEAGSMIAESETNKDRNAMLKEYEEHIVRAETQREVDQIMLQRINDRIQFDQMIREQQYHNQLDMERSDMMVAAEVFGWYAIMIMAIIASFVMGIVTLIWVTHHIRSRYQHEPQKGQTMIAQTAPAQRTQGPGMSPFYDEDRWHRDPIWRYQQIRLAREYEAANRQEEVSQRR